VLLAKKIDLDTNELLAELSAPLRGEARAYLYNPEPIALILTLTLTLTLTNPNAGLSAPLRGEVWAPPPLSLGGAAPLPRLLT